MTIPVLSWRGAILKTNLPSTTKYILLALGCHMNDFGEDCFPSIELLCKETGLSNRAVISHLKNAADAGWIAVEKHGYGGRRWARNEYRISWPDPERGSEPTSPPHNNEAVNVATRGSERSDNEAVNVVHTISSSNSPENSPVASKSRQPEKITFDASKNKFFIPLGCYPDWEKVFPKLDLDAEIDKAELWLSANPKRRKKNYERFLLGWFSRAVENAKPKVFVKQPQQGLLR